MHFEWTGSYEIAYYLPFSGVVFWCLFFFFIMFGFIEPLNSEKTLWMCNVFQEIVNICCFHLLGLVDEVSFELIT